MSLTEEAYNDAEYSALKADAGCTPKQSHRKSVTSNCRRNVMEIFAKRSPGLSCMSSSSSSWLHAFKTAKRTVESRKRVCCSPLQHDTVPVDKVVDTRCLSADSPRIVISSTSKNDTNTVYCNNKTSSSPSRVKVMCTCGKRWHLACCTL